MKDCNPVITQVCNVLTGFFPAVTGLIIWRILRQIRHSLSDLSQ